MTTWAEAQKKLKGVTFAVIGDLMLDEWIQFTATRLSPEAPVPIVKHMRDRSAAGGAGNTHSNLLATGAKVNLVGVAGADNAGTHLMQLIGPSPHCVLADNRETTRKTRFVIDKRQVFRADVNTQIPFSDRLTDLLVTSVKEATQDADVVIVSDYVRGVVSTRVWKAIVETGKPTIVDTKGDMEQFIGATVLKIAERDVTHAPGVTTADWLQQKIVDLMIGAIVYTRGEKGLTLATGGSVVPLNAAAQDATDPTGAGDTVTAWLAIGMALGLPIKDCCGLATVAAGIAVQHYGTAAPDPALVFGYFNRTPPNDVAARAIVPKGEALASCVRWGENGLRVGLANGCFDIQHDGHIKYLQWCRSRCDRLIVALNSDESIARLKGKGRPILSLKHRASNLAAMRCVDLVTVLEDDDPVNMARYIGPNVYFCGWDHAGDDVVNQIRNILRQVDVGPRFGEDSSTAILKEVTTQAH